METSKKTTNDNFSVFLNEYNNNANEKISWIINELAIVDKELDKLKNLPGSPFVSEINSIKEILNNQDINVLSRVSLSLKSLTELGKKYPLRDYDILSLSAFRPTITVYIEIAKYTSSEVLAQEVINFINSLILPLEESAAS